MELIVALAFIVIIGLGLKQKFSKKSRKNQLGKSSGRRRISRGVEGDTGHDGDSDGGGSDGGDSGGGD